MTAKDGSIFIKNVYYMLAYAFRSLNMSEYKNLATEHFEHMHDLFAAILARGITRQVKQGLYREYLPRSEDLLTVRGHIDLNSTMRNMMTRNRRVACDYDDLSENNLLNQVLKTTAMLLLRHGEVGNEHRSELRRAITFFSNVEELDPTAIHWETIRFQRSNRSYRVLLSVCQLVLEGMLLTTNKGEFKLANFIDDQQMSRLYEKFILEYYRAECSYVNVSSPQIKWALDDGFSTMLPIMQSDVTLSRENDVLIIDAKYYTHTMQQYFDTATIHSANMYQIFTYVKNKEAELAVSGITHKVSGMLLYARTDEDIQPDGVYQMSGNKISVKTLDLGLPFTEIRRQLDRIAEEHFAKRGC